MSRLARQPIAIPAKTEVTVMPAQAGSLGGIVVKGPKGSLSRPLVRDIEVVVGPTGVEVKIKNDSLQARALLGTYASHIRNMVGGVTDGFTKKLLVDGVGYKWEVQGKTLKLNLGFSHPVMMDIPEGLAVVAEKGALTISGFDKEVVGQFAANVRKQKKPEPYKGKGIRYDGEVIRRKQGKKAA